MSAVLLATMSLIGPVGAHRSLGAVLLGAAVLGALGWWGDTHRIRDAKGGPVKPATTRDYVIVAGIFTLAVAAVFVGLFFMKR